ncbi:translation initiation factor IF-2-like [Mauremys mutica]|uniref:translation initiation factor IF-2-like n=1 Tax=Mauremys mutica TaxID=74926 RepID=UPI001D16A47B|nr:translation initiation factor IF-2-like [Mauremys mutica]
MGGGGGAGLWPGFRGPAVAEAFAGLTFWFPLTPAPRTERSGLGPGGRGGETGGLRAGSPRPAPALGHELSEPRARQPVTAPGAPPGAGGRDAAPLTAPPQSYRGGGPARPLPHPEEPLPLSPEAPGPDEPLALRTRSNYTSHGEEPEPERETAPELPPPALRPPRQAVVACSRPGCWQARPLSDAGALRRCGRPRPLPCGRGEDGRGKLRVRRWMTPRNKTDGLSTQSASASAGWIQTLYCDVGISQEELRSDMILSCAEKHSEPGLHTRRK